MKKGGKAEGGESKATHKAEMSKMKGLEKELKSHESKPASKGHKGLKTGGVALGQGGYKKGGDVKKYAKGGVTGNGIINTENQGGKYRDTLMHTAEYTGKSSGKTGDVKNGNGGGYKTGGVALGNAGGFKAGGKTSKKAYATGGTVNSGKPVAMPQGNKPASKPVRINELAGTYKSGGTRLAIECGAPVIPVAVTSAKCWPRKALIKRPGVVDVSIGPAIASVGRKPDELMAEVEQWIEAEMRRLDPQAYAQP
jgi:hypothetical protein